MPNCPSPAAISIVDGSIKNGGTLQLGCPFYWANPTDEDVSIAGCGGFCTESSYSVPKKPAGLPYGITEAMLLTQPTSWTFGPETPNAWTPPGAPKIGNPPWPTPKNEEKEVA